MLLRSALSLASPRGPRGRLTILIFHRVLAAADPLLPDLPSAGEFEARMRWVKDWFNVLPLGPAVEMLFAGTIPARSIAITFDDGYADNEEIAAPILARLGLSATFFVATGFLGNGCMWNDQVIEAIRACRANVLDLQPLGLAAYPLASTAERALAIPQLLTSIKHLEPDHRQRVAAGVVEAAGSPTLPVLMMQPGQVRRLRELGMDIGAHTVTHPILARLGADAARKEMRRSRQELEDMVGAPVTLFAYPNGVPVQDYGAEHAAMARDCGFAAAVSTAWGAASIGSDRFQLPRFSPWDRTRLRYGARLLANLARAPVTAS